MAGFEPKTLNLKVNQLDPQSDKSQNRSKIAAQINLFKQNCFLQLVICKLQLKRMENETKNQAQLKIKVQIIICSIFRSVPLISYKYHDF